MYIPSSSPSSPSDTNSSSEQMLSTLTNISVTFSPTNGNDHVKTSMKLGSQYGCGEQLNWRIFITLFSYFSTAACNFKMSPLRKQIQCWNVDIFTVITKTCKKMYEMYWTLKECNKLSIHQWNAELKSFANWDATKLYPADKGQLILNLLATSSFNMSETLPFYHQWLFWGQLKHETQ